MRYKNDLERKDYNIRVRVDKLTYLKLNAIARGLNKSTSDVIRIFLNPTLQQIRLEDFIIEEREKNEINFK